MISAASRQSSILAHHLVAFAKPSVQARRLIDFGFMRFENSFRSGFEAQCFVFVASPWSAIERNLCDASDGLDIGIAANRAFDATMRTDRAGAQYPLLQRWVPESTSSNVKHFSAFRVKAAVGSNGIDFDTSGAGFGMSGGSKGKQHRCSNQGFHGNSLLVNGV